MVFVYVNKSFITESYMTTVRDTIHRTMSSFQGYEDFECQFDLSFSVVDLDLYLRSLPLSS